MLYRQRTKWKVRKMSTSKIVQLVKGIHCNAKCPMCLSLNNIYGTPPPNLSSENIPLIILRKLYKRGLELGKDELVITSYGDPLDHRNSVNSLCNEIQLARECGFNQVTLITNGIGLKDYMIKPLRASGLTHLTLSIHAVEQETYHKMIGINRPLESTLEKGKMAALLGVVVRHNYVWHSGLNLDDVIQQSTVYGATQLTLMESVLVNDFAKTIHCSLPDVPNEAKFLYEYGWGMSIYALDSITLALCRFGVRDESFYTQEKNLYINLRDDGRAVLRDGAYFDLYSGVLLAIQKAQNATNPQ